jgi:hypothetical protein
MAVYSIVSSVASAAFTVTDCSIMYERNIMHGQTRGPASHPFWGYIPDNGSSSACMHVGLYIFQAFYLGAGVAAIAAFIVSFHPALLFVIVFVEFAVYAGLMARRGQGYIIVAPANGGKRFSAVIYFSFYLLMCFAPWTGLRVDMTCGGRVFGGFIFYKLASYACIFYAATERFGDLEEVEMGAAEARKVFGATWWCAVLGAGIFLRSVRSSHRWTLYDSRQTGPEAAQWEFDAEQLMYGRETKDEQRVGRWLWAHPSYFDRVKVKAWLLRLKMEDELFEDEEKKLPRGVGSKAGHSFSSFFKNSLERYAWYGDDEGLEEIRAHLEALEAKIDSREKAAVVATQMTQEGEAAPAPEPRENKLKMEIDEKETEVDRLKRLLESEKKGRAAERKRAEVAEEKLKEIEGRS